jgi:hypothetical protein
LLFTLQLTHHSLSLVICNGMFHSFSPPILVLVMYDRKQAIPHSEHATNTYTGW